ncbi:SufD family Fe-S cluster assembly protein [Candidatus Woesearchaeota archaeon]|nr:SufD family Fe-S cluster assembly protein [Candidatus Woesearchaeota archaeon]
MMDELIISANEKRDVVLIHDRPESGQRVIRLVGPGAEVRVEEIFLSGDVTSNLVIVHDAMRTVSRVKTRGVVGKGQSVFAHAKVIIQKHAQLSDSFVSQKFMLLDKTSKAEAIPSLEIEADEVKASHAATISPLDQEKLFYVMARGLSYVDASKLLIEGFLELPRNYEHFFATWQPLK